MAKQIIRLTESDLHAMICEAVNQIIEGQGWDYVKQAATTPIDYSDYKSGDMRKAFSDPYAKKGMKNFIKHGNFTDTDYSDYSQEELPSHYDQDNPTHGFYDASSTFVNNKPINKSLSGKIGRAAGAAAGTAVMAARHGINKLTGRANPNRK